ncbi:NADPH:quinone oxidoreductase family protein [Novosphingobium sp. HII-3]|uniref:NADPH:quinone oxidoreductase family protein n=1 Tax=Novosphingobium sp. HII-3 TaxID=2075565 RepID=UPI000CDA70D6|nr:NADPH:quinone oxidoreductase family protein [Novosphingobium sp. HII-3]
MRALLSPQSGDHTTLQLRDVPEPIPGPGEVRVEVEAVGINYPDVLIIQDLYQFRPQRPFAPGAEFAGRIDAVGEGVDRFRVGQRVLGGSGWGGLADKVVLPADRCFAIPDSMPADEAAAFLMTYGTSQHALKDRGRIQSGDRLLVLGAAGGVGLAAVELGKAYKAQVIAAVSTAEKAEVARERGADATIIYPSGPLDSAEAKAFTAEIRKIAPDGVNIVYDGVGGDYAEPALRSMAWDGRYLVVGFPAGIPRLPLNLPLLKGCSIVGVFWGAFINHASAQHEANVAELISLYEAGRIKPLVSERFPLERGGEAIARLQTRSVIGKVVVTL